MTLSTAALRALFSRESTDPLIWMLVITHPAIEPLRLCNNLVGQNITSQGDSYEAFPFDIVVATDTDETPRARLRIANTDRRIGNALQLIAGSEPPMCRIILVLASAPDEIVKTWQRFELRNVRLDAMAVEADLMHPAFGSEPWPNTRVIPSLFPALFI